MLKIEVYQRAIRRNLWEIQQARLTWCVLCAFDRHLKNREIYHLPPSFFSIAQDALYDSTLMHAIKVLDRNRDSATFWGIFDTALDKIRRLNCYTEEKMVHLAKLEPKLKLVRDKTLFHIDKGAVLDPPAIWREAGIAPDEFKSGLEYVWEILRGLHIAEFNREYSDLCERYKGEDVAQILDLACSNGILQAGVQPVASGS